MSLLLDPVAGSVGASTIRIDDLTPSGLAYFGAVAEDVWQSNPVTMHAMRGLETETRLWASGLERRPRLGTEAGQPIQLGRGAEVIRDWQPTRLPPDQRERLVSVEEANARGAPLGLKYDRPVSETFLNAHIAWRRQRLINQEIFERARADGSYGTAKWLAAGGIELLVTAADPLNLVTAMLPVVREARFAIWAQRYGRTAAGVARGAIEGTVGNALVEAATAPITARLDPDYHMADSMLNIALGGVLGGGLHLAGAGVGAAWRSGQRGADALGARRARAGGDDAQARLMQRDIETELAAFGDRNTMAPWDMAKAVDAVRPETRDAALRVGLAQLIGEKPLDVEPILRADPAYVPPRLTQAGGPPRLLTDWGQAQSMAEHAQLVARSFTDATRPMEPPADFVPSPDVVEMAARIRRGRPAQPVGREPQTLSQWIAAQGGVARGGNGAGELLGQDLGRLVRSPENGGRALDDLALAAAEAGFYPQARAADGTITRPDLSAFIDDIVDDAAGRRRTYSDIGAAEQWRAARDANAQMRQWLADHLGVDPTLLTPRQLQYLLSLAEDLARDQALLRRVQLIERAGEAESLDVARALDAELTRAIEAEEARVRARLAERQRSLEPEEIDAELAARLQGQRPVTLEELEALHAEREAIDRSGGEGGRGGGADAGPGGEARPGADRVPDQAAGATADGTAGRGPEGRVGAEGEEGRVDATPPLRLELQLAGQDITVEIKPGGEARPAPPAEAAPTPIVRPTEATAQGQQYLLDGIAAITDAQRARVGTDAPLRGGDAGMPEGGLFDTTAQRQADLDDWIRRQAEPTNDRHADPAASQRAALDASAAELDARAELDALMGREGTRLSDSERVAIEAAQRPHEEMALAVEALAQCRIGGDA